MPPDKIYVVGEQHFESLSVKYEDVYNVKELYKFIRGWLIFNEWADNMKDNFMERFYLEKITQGNVKEYWWWWRLKKEKSKFITYKLNLDAHILGMRDIEIMHRGKKVKAQRGEVEIMLNGYIEFDSEKIRKIPFFGVFEERFKKRIYHKQLEEHTNLFRAEIYRLQDSIKRYLDLKGFLPESERFHPPKGL